MDGNAFSIIASEDDFGSGFKECTKCGEEKPLTEFHKGKVECKMCRSTKSKTKPGKARQDMVYRAMTDAAYRLLKEVTGL